MTKFDLGIMILAALAIIALVISLVLKLDVSVIIPIVTGLLTYLIGSKKEKIVGVFKKSNKK